MPVSMVARAWRPTKTSARRNGLQLLKTQLGEEATMHPVLMEVDDDFGPVDITDRRIRICQEQRNIIRKARDSFPPVTYRDRMKAFTFTILMKLRLIHMLREDKVMSVVRFKDHQGYLHRISSLLPKYPRGGYTIATAESKDTREIRRLVEEIVFSPEDKAKVLLLRGDAAKGFLLELSDAMKLMSGTPIKGSELGGPAQRLYVRLAVQSGIFIQELIVEVDELKFLAESNSARIYRGVERGTGLAVVVKCVGAENCISVTAEETIRLQRRIFREGNTWKSLEHSRILKFIGFAVNAVYQRTCLVSPLANQGTVMNYLKEYMVSTPDVNRLIMETAEGLEYIHQQKLVHGDLRGQNLLVHDHHILIADFGLSIFSTSYTGAFSGSYFWGSEHFKAPELFKHDDKLNRSPASDVYAFACTCIQLYTGNVPFYADPCPNRVELAKMVCNNERPDRPSRKGKQMKNSVWGVVTSCWEQEAEDRIDMIEVLQRLHAS